MEVFISVVEVCITYTRIKKNLNLEQWKCVFYYTDFHLT